MARWTATDLGVPWWRTRRVFELAVAAHLLALYSPKAVPQPHGDFGWDKLVHMILFGGLLWIGVRAGVAWRPLLGLLVLNAGLSEVVQGTLLPQRSGDVLDTLADLIGLLAAGLVLLRSARGETAVARP